VGIIHFQTKLSQIGTRTVLRLPESASAKLPSRGIVFVEGSINAVPFTAVLEPDGAGSHWFSLTSTLRENAKVAAGDTVAVSCKPSNNWPEPPIPEDFEQSLAASPDAHALWKDISPMARWDWIRWISATSRPETRRRRIEAACDKLKKGERRPCCFNRTLCTDPAVSKNGVLMEPQ